MNVIYLTELANRTSSQLLILVASHLVDVAQVEGANLEFFEGRRWIPRSVHTLAEDLCLTSSIVARALSQLRNLEMIETRIHVFHGVPTTFIWVNWKMLPVSVKSKILLIMKDKP